MNHVIEFKDFHKSFGSKKVHQGVSFTLNQGECLGLLGGSGAGKSLILRSLIGLEKPDKGQIIVEGQDITYLKERELIEIRKKVAYVFQGGALFDSMTVFENLAYPLREHTQLNDEEIRKKVLGLLEEFGLEGNEKLFPAELSGGMQKRVGLARSIIMDPLIVLYDEPTAGLDPYNTKRIQEMILRLKTRGVTSILVTHDMPTAMAVCDRVALLLQGSIAADAKTKDLGHMTEGILRQFIDGEEP